MVDDAPRVYLDASALVKLIVDEAESDALRRYLSSASTLISSRIAAVEVRRVAARQREHDAEAQVQSVMQGVLMVEVGHAIAMAAGAASPPSLRSLDAIHLVSALSIGDLGSLITYDTRLADAARAAGLTVVAPA